MDALEHAVLESGRWRKWLHPGEAGAKFRDLPPPRRAWLVQTGARYVWTEAGVRETRQRLYDNLAGVMPDPHQFVVDRICRAMHRYVRSFHLFGSQAVLAPGASA
jgi:hypothetical protein